jgi:hypothetical protein
MSGGEVMWPLGEMELAAASARGRLVEVGHGLMTSAGQIDRIVQPRQAASIAIMIMNAVIQ